MNCPLCNNFHSENILFDIKCCISSGKLNDISYEETLNNKNMGGGLQI